MHRQATCSGGGERGMGVDERALSGRRAGLSRFIVPHESFGWLTKRVWVTALGTSIFLGALAWMQHYYLFRGLPLSDLSEHSQILERYVRSTLLNGVVFALAYAMYVTIVAAFLIHRISGPIYRIKRHMAGVAAGEVTSECSLRKGDQLLDVCDTYNQLLQALDVIEPKALPEVDPTAS